MGVQKAAKPPEDGSKEKLEDRATKRAEERVTMKKQMKKDRGRFKEGLPTSPIGNDARRASEIASFGVSDVVKVDGSGDDGDDSGGDGSVPPAATTEISTDPSQSESVVSKEGGMNVTDYS